MRLIVDPPPTDWFDWLSEECDSYARATANVLAGRYFDRLEIAERLAWDAVRFGWMAEALLHTTEPVVFEVAS